MERKRKGNGKETERDKYQCEAKHQLLYVNGGDVTVLFCHPQLIDFVYKVSGVSCEDERHFIAEIACRKQWSHCFAMQSPSRTVPIYHNII